MKKSYNILSYFNMRALFIGIGISKILATSHEYHYISIILGTILGLLILKFLKIELKDNNIVNVIISSILIILSLIIAVNMISTMYLTKMSKFFIALPIILVLMYFLKCKEVVIYRIINLLLVLNLLFYVFIIITLAPNTDVSNLMYTGVSFVDVIKASIQYALISTVPVFISRDKNTSNISVYKTYIISSATMLLMIFTIYLVIGPDMADILRYPEYIVLKSINISDSITNLENMLSLVWLMDLMVFVATCGNTIKRQINNKTILNSILIIILLIVTIINRYYQLILYSYIYIVPILLISLILLYITNKRLN